MKPAKGFRTSKACFLPLAIMVDPACARAQSALESGSSVTEMLDTNNPAHSAVFEAAANDTAIARIADEDAFCSDILDRAERKERHNSTVAGSFGAPGFALVRSR